MRVLGVITARGGSKGIPQKNIALLAGKPLLTYTIAAAAASQLLTRCLVSTDDPAIAQVATAAGADVPFLRPADLASDTSRSLDVVHHALHTVEQANDQPYDAVLILQPTSPLRSAADIDAAIELLQQNPTADSVVSLIPLVGLSVYKLKLLRNVLVLPAYTTEVEGIPRQDNNTLYQRDGAVYLTRRATLLAGSLYGAKILGYVMPAERSVDINTPIDLAFAEFLIHYSQR
jgi:CMP-N-acetylneuraminic acid synthetase